MKCSLIERLKIRFRKDSLNSEIQKQKEIQKIIDKQQTEYELMEKKIERKTNELLQKNAQALNKMMENTRKNN